MVRHLRAVMASYSLGLFLAFVSGVSTPNNLTLSVLPSLNRTSIVSPSITLVISTIEDFSVDLVLIGAGNDELSKGSVFEQPIPAASRTIRRYFIRG